MEKPSFSHSIYNFLGTLGFIILFTIIIAYARNPEWNGTTMAIAPVAALSVSSGSISNSPVQPVVQNTLRESTPFDPVILSQGKTLYQTFCASCHGLPGVQRSPLLTGSDVFDEVSVYGTDPGTIKRLIEEGIIEVGMVPWKSVLTNEQTDSIVAYILSERYITPSGNG